MPKLKGFPKYDAKDKESLINPKDEKPDLLSTEEEVKKLREELAKKEAELAKMREERPKVEIPPIVKKEIPKEKEKIEKVVERPVKPLKAPPKAVKLPFKIQDEELIRDLQHVMALEKPKQVKMLVYLAFKKGVNHAASIALQLKDPYLLDEFHDTLVDQLYDLLVKRRKLS